MKKLITTLFFAVLMFNSAFSQHKFPTSFYFKYPKGIATISLFVCKDTVQEGTDYYMKNPSKLPNEASRWWKVFTVLTGTHFNFETGSIPTNIDSMTILLGNLNPDQDSTKKDFDDLVGEPLWLYLEATVYANGQVYDKNNSFFFNSGKFAVLRIPISEQLKSIWQKTFGKPLDEAGFAYLIDGTWNNDGASCKIENGEVVIKLPHFSKFGGGGKTLGTTTSAQRQSNSAPLTFDLSQNFPNPFNPSTKINYTIPSNGFVSLKVYNTIGVEICTLVSGYKDAGTYEVTFNAGGLPSGTYFYTLSRDNKILTNKMMIIK